VQKSSESKLTVEITQEICSGIYDLLSTSR